MATHNEKPTRKERIIALTQLAPDKAKQPRWVDAFFQQPQSAIEEKVQKARNMKCYPVIVDRQPDCDKEINQHLFLCRADTTLAQLTARIRKHWPKQDAIMGYHWFANGTTVPAMGQMISQIYNENKNDCGFLVITYTEEQTYG